MYHRDLDTDEVFEWLERCDMADFSQSCGSNPAATNEQEKNSGIVYGHGYTLISTHRIELDGQPMRFVKLRNPCGCGEWNGPWGDKSPEWTVRPRRSLGGPTKTMAVSLWNGATTLFISARQALQSGQQTSPSKEF